MRTFFVFKIWKRVSIRLAFFIFFYFQFNYHISKFKFTLITRFKHGFRGENTIFLNDLNIIRFRKQNHIEQNIYCLRLEQKLNFFLII